MKRVFLAVGLGAAIAAAWVLYPSRAHAGQATDSGCALLVGRITFMGLGGAKGLLTTTLPDGQLQTQELEVKAGTHNSLNTSLDQLHLSELKRLNEPRAAGWRVKTTTQTGGAIGGTFYETTYLLEKE